jgi:hypothetical protein
MALIDDQGRLFGIVNVVDAFVLLVVGAVVVAGVAFVLQPDTQQPAEPTTPVEPAEVTASAVLDLGSQPAYVAAAIRPGDSYAPTSNAEITVTKIHYTPEDDSVRVVLGVELTGVRANSTFIYDDAPLRLGRQLVLQTANYTASGTIRSTQSGLAQNTTQVLVRSRASAATAARIQPGNTYRLADRDVATVRTVSVYATKNPDQRRVLIGLSIATVDLGNGPQFGGALVRPGRRITFKPTGDSLPALSFERGEYSLTGRILQVGSFELPGEANTREVSLSMRNVPPYLADSIEEGMAETNNGQTLATITDVERSPSKIVVVSQDGTVDRRDHPTDEDLTITAELSVRETPTGVTFKGKTIQRGSTIVLDLGTVTVEATVTSL